MTSRPSRLRHTRTFNGLSSLDLLGLQDLLIHFYRGLLLMKDLFVSRSFKKFVNEVRIFLNYDYNYKHTETKKISVTIINAST